MIMMKTMLASAAAVALTAGMAVADYTLTVLHTNDFHARFEPISKYDSGCGEEDNAEGKVLWWLSQIGHSHHRSPRKVGKFNFGGWRRSIQGTLFYTYYKGKTGR
jgi:5'-nucleotidase